MADATLSELQDAENGTMSMSDFERARGYDPRTRTYSEVEEKLPSQEKLAVLYKRWLYRK
jgi:hypothetical protein